MFSATINFIEINYLEPISGLISIVALQRLVEYSIVIRDKTIKNLNA